MFSGSFFGLPGGGGGGSGGGGGKHVNKHVTIQEEENKEEEEGQESSDEEEEEENNGLEEGIPKGPVVVPTEVDSDEEDDILYRAHRISRKEREQQEKAVREDVNRNRLLRSVSMSVPHSPGGVGGSSGDLLNKHRQDSNGSPHALTKSHSPISSGLFNETTAGYPREEDAEWEEDPEEGGLIAKSKPRVRIPEVHVTVDLEEDAPPDELPLPSPPVVVVPANEAITTAIAAVQQASSVFLTSTDSEVKPHDFTELTPYKAVITMPKLFTNISIVSDFCFAILHIIFIII